MAPDRRLLLAAAFALCMPATAGAARKKPPKPCTGRAAYAGGPLRPQIAAAQLDAAAKAGAARLTPFASDRLDDRLAAAGARLTEGALTAAVARPDGGLWTQTVTAPGAGAPPGRFDWPCLEPALTATVLLQLVEEGRLSLAATLSRWAPEAPNAAWITVEDLLAGVSGLEDPPPNRCPGALMSAGEGAAPQLRRILEAVETRPRAESVQRRIVERLELRETVVRANGGGVFASSADAVRIWRAVLSDRLHGTALTRQRFFRLYPLAQAGSGYAGLGAAVVDLPPQDGRGAETWLSAAPLAADGRSLVAYGLASRTFLAVAGPRAAGAARSLT